MVGLFIVDGFSPLFSSSAGGVIGSAPVVSAFGASFGTSGLVDGGFALVVRGTRRRELRAEVVRVAVRVGFLTGAVSSGGFSVAFLLSDAGG